MEHIKDLEHNASRKAYKKNVQTIFFTNGGCKMQVRLIAHGVENCVLGFFTTTLEHVDVSFLKTLSSDLDGIVSHNQRTYVGADVLYCTIHYYHIL